MNLIDENEEKEQQENQKKIIKIILITIVVLAIIGSILLFYSVAKRKSTLKLEIDGKSQDITTGMFYSEDSKNLYVDENNNIYISVKKLASALGAEYFNDEYKNKGEDTSKCYIKIENEYTSYISGSSEMYKAIITEEEEDDDSYSASKTNKINKEEKKKTEYEYFNMGNEVKNINGEIYASTEAIELGFNVKIYYDESHKDIKIYTLDALEKTAIKRLENASVIPVTGEECSYQNKKLLKYGLVLIKNAQDGYGITNYNNYSDGNYVLSCKYSEIKFCEDTGNIIVTTLDDEKQGIMKLDFSNTEKVQTLVEPNYQLIKKMDEDLNLYVVKTNGRYGIVKMGQGEVETILRAEYQQIGLEKAYENMKSKYIINGKYIPIEIDELWGIVTIDGEMIIRPQFYGIGCDLKENSTGDPVVVLPKLVKGDDVIVCLTSKDSVKYSLVNVRTCTKIGLEGSEVYSILEQNKKEYYLKIEYDQGVSITVNIYNQFGDSTQQSSDAEENQNSETNN